MFACWRGWGTIRRGAGAVDGVGVGDGDGVPEAATFGRAEGLGAAAGGAVVAAAGGTTTAGRVAAGGVDLATASACLRSRIAFSASPGLETLDRSNRGLVSEDCREPPLPPRPPPVRYPRTFSASSASMELE